MNRPPLAITGAGMVTGVGLSAAASCAAIRGAIDSFQETRFRDTEGQWIVGSEVRFSYPWRGEAKLCRMIASAISECCSTTPALVAADTPLMLCLAETGRPGRCPDNDDAFLHQVEAELGVAFHAESRIFSSGRVSIGLALHHARRLLGNPAIPRVVVAAVDTLLAAPAIRHFETARRLLTSANSDGFIPGEAAAAFVVEPSNPLLAGHPLLHGIGFGLERAFVGSGEPLRADGLTTAIRQALEDCGGSASVLEFKIFDASGEQYRFREASLAFSRIDRTRRSEFPVWHPADCIGEVGAAIGPVMVGVLKAAWAKHYAGGQSVLMHLGNDDGRRCAMILSAQKVGW